MQQVLLLHGALGAAVQLDELKDLLSQHFMVYTLDFEGHGSRTVSRDFSIAGFGQNVLDFLQEKQINSCAVFGYSMGGYVALKLAAENPEIFSEIITLGTKFAWSPALAEKETALLQPEQIELKVPKFAESLHQLHGSNWKNLMLQTAGLMTELGHNPVLHADLFRRIEIPVTLLLGENDTMVSREETISVKDQLPHARFQIIPNCQHPIERVNLEDLALTIRNILKTK